MATATLGKRSSRIDLRMTDQQKSMIEEAADANGMSVSQWAIVRLLESARTDILSSRTIALSEAAFDRFAALLDDPKAEAPSTFDVFLDEQTIWEG